MIKQIKKMKKNKQYHSKFTYSMEISSNRVKGNTFTHFSTKAKIDNKQSNKDKI